jgi:hypothetical protein
MDWALGYAGSRSILTQLVAALPTAFQKTQKLAKIRRTKDTLSFSQILLRLCLCDMAVVSRLCRAWDSGPEMYWMDTVPKEGQGPNLVVQFI